MGTTLAPARTSVDPEAPPVPGSFVRHFAVSSAGTFAALVAVMMVTAPTTARSPVLWTLLAVVTGGAALTYMAGLAIGRRATSVE